MKCLQNLKGFVNLQLIAVPGPTYAATIYANVLMDTDRMQPTNRAWAVSICLNIIFAVFWFLAGAEAGEGWSTGFVGALGFSSIHITNSGQIAVTVDGKREPTNRTIVENNRTPSCLGFLCLALAHIAHILVISCDPHVIVITNG